MAKKMKVPNEGRPTIVSVLEKYGESALCRAGQIQFLESTPRFKTGVLGLDLLLGGGVPRGKRILIEGHEGSGKTLLLLKIIAAAQRYCRHCLAPLVEWDELLMLGAPIKKPCNCEVPEPMRVLMMDVEDSWEHSWARKMGVSRPEDILLATQTQAEQLMDIGTDMIRTGEVDLIGLDTIAFMAPTALIEKSVADSIPMALANLMARVMAKWFNATASLPRQYRPTIVMLNQNRTKLVPIGPRQTKAVNTAPGGRAVRQAAHVVIETKREEIVSENGRPLRHVMSIACPKKNKLAVSGTSWLMDFALRNLSEDRFMGSSDIVAQALRMGQQYGLILRAGSWIQMPDGTQVQGMEKAAAYLGRPENRKSLRTLIEQVEQAHLSWAEDKFNDGDDESAVVGSGGGEDSEVSEGIQTEG